MLICTNDVSFGGGDVAKVQSFTFLTIKFRLDYWWFGMLLLLGLETGFVFHVLFALES